MKNLITRTVTGILFVAAVVCSIVFYGNCSFFFYILFLAFTLVGTWELLQMVEKIGGTPLSMIPLLLSALVFSIPFLCELSLSGENPYLLLKSFACGVGMAFLLFVPLVFILELFRYTKQPLGNVAVGFLPMLWVALPFSLISSWVIMGESAVAVSFFVIIWLNDTLAYCSGRLFGKHKLCERISPKKTIEGFAIALVLTIALSLVFPAIPFFAVQSFTSPLHWGGFAAVVVLAGTLGDLVESMFKRQCGVKDSGKILPGHGGVLDRFDSSLLAAPVAFVYWLLVSVL
ncbi:MAG: phosphatidate cytidylyltransferase [Bacteroidales bacterium]|nr:phosphatidate cytidylyltransferase [Bacteroidales bacterium]